MSTKPRLFERVEDYVFEPLHPKFVGTADVAAYSSHQKKDLNGPSYRVDLRTGTCTCRLGKAWNWHEKHQSYTDNEYCSHKLRAIADIIDQAGRPSDMMSAYCKALASRYNVYEVVSAFHKELRREDVEKAIFWGGVLGTFRGVPGIYRYLLNIIYEETRDHELAEWLLEKITTKDMTFDGARKAIHLFATSPKKWFLPHRMKFLEAEMQGYRRLVDEFGRDVAKGSDIIPNPKDATRKKLRDALIKGIKTKDLALAQYGLKGLQKMKHGSDLDEHRAWILNECIEHCALPIVKRWPGYMRLEAFITKRAESGLGIGYHEVNAFVDFLCGEQFRAGLRTPEAFKGVLAAKTPDLRLGVCPSIPIYAHDNHTWAGKAALRRFPNEYQPGAKQEHFDLRLCGAYMGVVYRHLAVQQHRAIDCEWADVKWPDWLHGVVSDLWY